MVHPGLLNDKSFGWALSVIFTSSWVFFLRIRHLLLVHKWPSSVTLPSLFLLIFFPVVLLFFISLFQFYPSFLPPLKSPVFVCYSLNFFSHHSFLSHIFCFFFTTVLSHLKATLNSLHPCVVCLTLSSALLCEWAVAPNPYADGTELQNSEISSWLVAVFHLIKG